MKKIVDEYREQYEQEVADIQAQGEDFPSFEEWLVEALEAWKKDIERLYPPRKGRA